jgi:hypothetical protein
MPFIYSFGYLTGHSFWSILVGLVAFKIQIINCLQLLKRKNDIKPGSQYGKHPDRSGNSPAGF